MPGAQGPLPDCVYLRGTAQARVVVAYSGKIPSYIDLTSGEVIPVELFAAVLGASNYTYYTYLEATRTQQVSDWISSHRRAFEFLGGVPEAIVCDHLKSGVVRPCRYEPGLQRTYEEFIQHDGAVILPARPGEARDMAKVEVGIQVAQRWVLARLRPETCFSLDALNARLAEWREALNARVMRLYRASRRDLFERLDRPGDAVRDDRRGTATALAASRRTVLDSDRRGDDGATHP